MCLSFAITSFVETNFSWCGFKGGGDGGGGNLLVVVNLL